jgi:hypothetical protein
VTGLDTSGTGFIVFYEMMTGTLDLKIRAIDSSYTLACLLLHLMAPAETQRPQASHSLTHSLTEQPPPPPRVQ